MYQKISHCQAGFFYLIFNTQDYAQLAAARVDQRASCAGLEGASRTTKKPPPLLRSRTLPAIVVPGVNILQAQLGNYNQDVPQQQQPIQVPPANQFTPKVGVMARFQSSRVSFSRDDTLTLDVRRKSAVSKLCGTGNYGSERKSDGTLFLR
ncbi:hypothetical protein MML48_8g00008707 [Holotrichia oblita]|uniref:Uncharacterized protein n=1 Tax=Holotrichia oblita TaxID=644536 RepID=A0ACB9SN35_HOLOL|nr:hypothetical protein MML48_8g00008707 [Holotrichia oblita]